MNVTSCAGCGVPLLANRPDGQLCAPCASTVAGLTPQPHPTQPDIYFGTLEDEAS